MKSVTIIILALALVACEKPPMEGDPPESSEQADHSITPENNLADVLAAQADEVKARYRYRHPEDTLAFFGITPGMTVVEALPGGGWYSKILLPYLGKDGRLIGADYAQDMYPKFGFYDDKFLEGKKTWIQDWTAQAESWRPEDSAPVSAFVLGSMPDDLAGTADAVLFIRALHNLQNYEGDGGYMTAALQDGFRVLKPGGIVGIVQHQSRDGMSDEWADGSNGYLKKSLVVASMESAGFELLASTDINANENDRPTNEEYVWRLPPGLDGSADNPELRAAMQAIGESNRMTLKFRKPE